MQRLVAQREDDEYGGDGGGDGSDGGATSTDTGSSASTDGGGSSDGGGDGAADTGPPPEAIDAAAAQLDPDTIVSNMAGAGTGAGDLAPSGPTGDDATAQALSISVQRDPPSSPPTDPAAPPAAPKQGSVGDILSALAAVPEIKAALEKLKTLALDTLKTDWSKLQTGEKAAVVTTGVVIVGGALAGALANPDSRSVIEGQISGKFVPIPATPVQIKIDITKDRVTGGAVQVDLAPLIRKIPGVGQVMN